MIEANKVSTLIVKDMSRLGRNYLEVGQLSETFLPVHNVRLITVNDGVYSDKGEDDFAPFRNIMNEWYAKDMSRKMRSTFKLKSLAMPSATRLSDILMTKMIIKNGRLTLKVLKLLRKFTI